jgi:putative oxidoreductase
MDRFLGRYATYIYAILRIVTGFLFIWHGSQKLFGFPPQQTPPGSPPPDLSPLMATAGVLEFALGLMVMIGLFTAFAAFIASGEMAVAYFMVHFSTGNILPLTNRGELAVLFCFVFLYIAARGAGVWSIDSLFRGSSATSTA